MSGTFVDLAEDRGALLAMLRDCGLAEADESPVVEALTGGVSSTILRVGLRAGDVCVKQALPRLKVAKEWLAPTDRVFAEIDWLEAVGAILPGNVPHVLARDKARGALVMAYLAPQDHPNWKTEMLAGRLHAEAGAKMGDILGTIHARTARDPGIAARFDNDRNFHALRLEPYLLETAGRHPDLHDRLHDIVRETQSHKLALVHGDVSPKNILLGAAGPILIDAECACHGDPAFDLAFLLNHLLLKAIHRPDRAAALAALFDSTTAHYSRHVQWEPLDTFEARAARLLPALLLARIDGKSPVEYLSEPQRSQARNLARPLVSDGPDRLLDVAGSVFGALSK